MTAGNLHKESLKRKFNSDSLFPTLSSELLFYWVCSKGWPKIRIIRINYPTFSTWSTLGTIDPSTCSYERKKIQIEADTYGQGVVQAVRRTEYSFAQVCDSYYDYDISLCGGQLKKTLIKTVIIWAFFSHHTSHTGNWDRDSPWQMENLQIFLLFMWAMIHETNNRSHTFSLLSYVFS